MRFAGARREFHGLEQQQPFEQRSRDLRPRKSSSVPDSVLGHSLLPHHVHHSLSHCYLPQLQADCRPEKYRLQFDQKENAQG